MGIFSDLLGTVRTSFRIGLTGVRLKDAGGNLLVRNNADGADAAITASKVSVSGELLELNSDAAGAAADWKTTIQRPAAGQAAALTFTLPPNAGSTGQVMQTDGAGVLTFVSLASSASSDKIDTTALAFGSASPVAMFSTGASDVIDSVAIVIDTAFNGAPSVSIGISGTTSKYMAATDVDLTAAAGTVFLVHPGLAAAGAEALMATYTAGGASAGAARILVHYATPS